MACFFLLQNIKQIAPRILHMSPTGAMLQKKIGTEIHAQQTHEKIFIQNIWWSILCVQMFVCAWNMRSCSSHTYFLNIAFQLCRLSWGQCRIFCWRVPSWCPRHFESHDTSWDDTPNRTVCNEDVWCVCVNVFAALVRKCMIAAYLMRTWCLLLTLEQCPCRPCTSLHHLRTRFGRAANKKVLAHQGPISHVFRYYIRSKAARSSITVRHVKACGLPIFVNNGYTRSQLGTNKNWQSSQKRVSLFRTVIPRTVRPQHP